MKKSGKTVKTQIVRKLLRSSMIDIYTFFTTKVVVSPRTTVGLKKCLATSDNRGPVIAAPFVVQAFDKMQLEPSPKNRTSSPPPRSVEAVPELD